MKRTTFPPAFATMSFALAAAVLLAACGGSGNSAGPSDAAVAREVPVWPPEVTVSTCQDWDSVTVGSYVVQANYWNKRACPGTQCMDINNATAAFTVTRGPDPCGNTVATYPNVLYGCSFGNCSPGSLLPLPMSAVQAVTSSWDFTVGGSAADQYDVAYDIWFCPDNNCGGGGFPGGLEMMIWLDYKNLSGWQVDLGQVKLGGYTWEVWQATMGSGARSWSYLAYMIKGAMVDQVTNLDLNAFFQDAAARGYLQSAWYLYAIQAGDELRTGGVPYTSNSFSVTINGITPSTAPASLADAGAVDGAVTSPTDVSME
jgi:hypothetical protein